MNPASATSATFRYSIDVMLISVDGMELNQPLLERADSALTYQLLPGHHVLKVAKADMKSYNSTSYDPDQGYQATFEIDCVAGAMYEFAVDKLVIEKTICWNISLWDWKGRKQLPPT